MVLVIPVQPVASQVLLFELSHTPLEEALPLVVVLPIAEVSKLNDRVAVQITGVSADGGEEPIVSMHVAYE
jgi:hypothetical protein